MALDIDRYNGKLYDNGNGTNYLITAAHRHSRLPKSRQYVTSVLARCRIFDEERGLMKGGIGIGASTKKGCLEIHITHSLSVWTKPRAAVGVHCRQGRARSGVMLAAYMVRFHQFLPDQAIALIRDLRTGSCEYPEHEEAVVLYHKHLTKDNPGSYGVTPETINEVAETARAFNKRK
ncbi:Dual specificity protein phosphatase 23 [Eumeta japonica]|uniref:Dual specificity protein phosphatase 23 n=1 Tax=Eumeta variegata TaxID=151549 RepID=A0A4C1U3B6_EUMVA|nr:Dual specificity protein phosphatase 23 [Eumeta japonica]